MLKAEVADEIEWKKQNSKGHPPTPRGYGAAGPRNVHQPLRQKVLSPRGYGAAGPPPATVSGFFSHRGRREWSLGKFARSDAPRSVGPVCATCSGARRSG